ncbi:MAG TPA: hypothetical protein VFE78_27510 [Gemmataceae bacterium]|jgi:hypothetical protein|nr:hypothetical protein [Gemmataceae bacterium]
MRNMLAFLAAVVLTVAVLGWYLDWYKVQSHSATEGHQNLSIDINTTKIGTDLQKGEQNLQKILEKNAKQAAGSIGDAKGAAEKKAPAEAPKAADKAGDKAKSLVEPQDFNPFGDH